VITTFTKPRLTAPGMLPSRDRGSSSIAQRRIGDEPMKPGMLRRLMDAVIRAAPRRREFEAKGLEWALIDTHGFDPGEYSIRGWTDSNGVARPVDQSERRQGGAIGLFTLDDGHVSVGPCPPTVDEGAGLLLIGFTHMMTLPLPRPAAETLGANWTLILGRRRENFSNAEVDRALLLLWAISM